MALALTLFLLTTCSSTKPGADIGAAERVPVVDFHLHPGEWSQVPEATREFLAERFPFPFNLDPEALAAQVLSADGIASELDAAGISVGVLFAVYAPQTVGVATNELVADYLADKPDRFYGLASLRVDRWAQDSDAELARLADALTIPGMIGIKLAHAHQNFRMDDPAYFGIYELSGNLGKPVYLHTGPSPFPGTAREPEYTDPAYLEAAIAAHPDTIFILGHIGYDFINKQLGMLETCISLAQRYPNVYLEPSALGSRGSDPTGANLPAAMAAMRAAGVVDRIIYGSDGPQSPGFVSDYLGRTIAAMRASDYTDDEMRAVLAGNFARVFGVPVPELSP